MRYISSCFSNEQLCLSAGLRHVTTCLCVECASFVSELLLSVSLTFSVFILVFSEFTPGSRRRGIRHPSWQHSEWYPFFPSIVWIKVITFWTRSVRVQIESDICRWSKRLGWRQRGLTTSKPRSSSAKINHQNIMQKSSQPLFEGFKYTFFQCLRK